MAIMDERDFARFELQMSFGQHVADYLNLYSFFDPGSGMGYQ